MCDAYVIEANLKSVDVAIVTLQHQGAAIFRSDSNSWKVNGRLIQYVLQRHCYTCYSVITIDAPCDLTHFHVLTES